MVPGSWGYQPCGSSARLGGLEVKGWTRKTRSAKERKSEKKVLLRARAIFSHPPSPAIPESHDASNLVTEVLIYNINEYFFL